MKRVRIPNLLMRIGLFVLILTLGTVTALAMDETDGLALADLSGASVQALAVTAKGDVVCAAQTGGSQAAGIYCSHDGGRTWAIVCSAPGLTVNTLAAHPTDASLLYAGTAGGPKATAISSLWRSNDGGHNWYEFVSDLPADPYDQIPTVTALAVDPNQPEVLYVGTNGQGVYRFDEKQPGFDLLGDANRVDAHVSRIAVGPDGRVYALINYDLFVNRGQTWQALKSLPDQAMSLAVAPSDPQTLYVGSAASGAYRSTDGGRTWQHISDNLGLTPGAALRVTAIAVDKYDARHVVAGTAYSLGSRLVGGGIYESTDGGQQWTEVDKPNGLVRELVIQKGSILAATSNGMRRYGQPIEPLPASPVSEAHRLVNPSGTQVLVLIFTVGLAALVLLGPTDRGTGHGMGQS